MCSNLVRAFFLFSLFQLCLSQNTKYPNGVNSDIITAIMVAVAVAVMSAVIVLCLYCTKCICGLITRSYTRTEELSRSQQIFNKLRAKANNEEALPSYQEAVAPDACTHGSSPHCYPCVLQDLSIDKSWSPPNSNSPFN